MQGRITKGIAGFYYVHDGKHLYECKAKGIFRKNREKPLVGDYVEFDVISEQEKEGNITSILDRKNQLIRPEIANVDQLFLQFAASAPKPNYDMLNRYLVMLYHTEIPVHLVVNKSELVTEEERAVIVDEFKNSGYPIHFISVNENTGLSELTAEMEGKVTAVAGPSGVGKSSLMNALFKRTVMETGDLSEKIDRGKNTTRHSEIFYLKENTFVFDTPGFTAVEVDYLEKEDIAMCFNEFDPYIGKCRFNSCNHYKEPDCAVKNAVRAGNISLSRYKSYRAMYENLLTLRRF